MTRSVKTTVSFMAAILLLIAAILWQLSTGDIHLGLIETLRAVFDIAPDQTAWFVVWQLRMPHLLAAVITGGALAISGMILQTLTRNPLADSSILGINAGASLGAVLLIGASGVYHFHYSDNGLALVVLLGALLSASLVFFVNRQGSATRVLLGGVALTSVLNGIILLIQLQLNQFDFEEALIWLSGSFWDTDMGFLMRYFWLYLILLVCTVCALRLLSGLTLGQEMAKAIGVNVKLAQRLLMLLAIGLTTVAVSVGGAISFVGLMAPNIAKRLVGARPRLQLPLSWLIGTLIMVVADVIANNGFGKVTLPVGLIVAMITMPYFIYLLFFQKRHV
ncbi:FecCD family ABC transporter permease [Secundilactobacillus paracollinoides]|uniref:Ferrichrome ABC transporter permease n=1 Tax=Secundilactobacillus paracollinoides TaxID=240427 RepID=A0A1B2IX38_9LACO|nr:iron ABC transporter permease [Secundilactobacillus paracollinoides]ANZ60801.1 ferrichrome ABC transporter permease [Secundilactobacillus paracollinoides]ANZ66646.1 ferrichrome ABC transporter permease [Secundilactobacillus paracollinoides]